MRHHSCQVFRSAKCSITRTSLSIGIAHQIAGFHCIILHYGVEYYVTHCPSITVGIMHLSDTKRKPIECIQKNFTYNGVLLENVFGIINPEPSCENPAARTAIEGYS